MVSTLKSICFGSPQRDHAFKTKKYETLDR